jgi:hypothetical protein
MSYTSVDNIQLHIISVILHCSHTITNCLNSHGQSFNNSAVYMTKIEVLLKASSTALYLYTLSQDPSALLQKYFWDAENLCDIH